MRILILFSSGDVEMVAGRAEKAYHIKSLNQR